MKTILHVAHTATLLLLLTSIGLSAPVPAGRRANEEDLAKEIERLQGDWVLVETIGPNGTVCKHKEGQPGTDHFNIYIKKNWAIFHCDGTDPDDEIVTRFTLDPSKMPKQIDFTGVSSTITGYKKGRKELGIYKLDGEALILAEFDENHLARPTDFNNNRKKKIWTYKFVRSKKLISEDSTRVNQRPPLDP